MGIKTSYFTLAIIKPFWIEIKYKSILKYVYVKYYFEVIMVRISFKNYSHIKLIALFAYLQYSNSLFLFLPFHPREKLPISHIKG